MAKKPKSGADKASDAGPRVFSHGVVDENAIDHPLALIDGRWTVDPKGADGVLRCADAREAGYLFPADEDAA